jgi:hypothetical protein
MYRISIDEELRVGQTNHPWKVASRDTPFLLSKRVKRTVLREVYSIKLQEHGFLDLWVEQLELALKAIIDIHHA